MPVTEYCLSAIQQQLADDELLEAEWVTMAVKTHKPADSLIADLHSLRASILTDRGGKLLDIDVIMDQTRDERDDELTNMR